MTIRSRLHAVDPYENFPVAGAQLDLQGWHSADPVFAKLIDEIRPERIIEVGTWKGASAIGMAGLAKQRGLKTEILCIDTWLGALEFWTSHDDPTRYGSLKLRHGYPGVYYTFLANVVLSGHRDMITPFPQTSLTGARWLNMQGLQADLIYIDGSHEEADVLADVAAFWPAVKPGGIIFGDDFSASWPSVQRAVRAFAKQNGLVLEDDNEFWIIRKSATLAASPVVMPAQSDRSLLLVHAAESARASLTPFIERLGYRFIDPARAESDPRHGPALWVAPGEEVVGLDDARAKFGDVQSLFWVEQPDAAEAELPAWCQHWQQSLAQAGGLANAVALYPSQPLAAQRERCELLCRRCGVDLAALCLVDDLIPRAAAPARPDPAGGIFAVQNATLYALGLSPHEFFAFPTFRHLEATPADSRLENPEGGSLEPYTPSHFVLHPPKPGEGWTRLYLRGVDWQHYRHFSTTLSLPSDQAPAVRFQWNIISPQGDRLHTSETVLNARDVKTWVVALPHGVPAGSFAMLATCVESSPTHDYAWSTWRDPILFS